MTYLYVHALNFPMIIILRFNGPSLHLSHSLPSLLPPCLFASATGEIVSTLFGRSYQFDLVLIMLYTYLSLWLEICVPVIVHTQFWRILCFTLTVGLSRNRRSESLHGPGDHLWRATTGPPAPRHASGQPHVKAASAFVIWHAIVAKLLQALMLEYMKTTCGTQR